ncbi:MAG: hypothetical protein ACPGWR_02400, partial [Ardenticatenaceae bacterium]
MDRYTTAGAILVLLGILWAARALYVNRTGGSVIAETKILVGWMDMDILSALGLYPVFFIIWFGGNILFGNMVAIQAIINWINTLNTTGSFSISPWAIAAIAIAPSSAQWWIKQFAPPNSKTFVVTWIIIGTDVALNTFGFWALAHMPTDYSVMNVGHWIVLVVFIALAGFVNVYCENIVHDSLSRLMRWFKGQPVKGAI